MVRRLTTFVIRSLSSSLKVWRPLVSVQQTLPNSGSSSKRQRSCLQRVPGAFLSKPTEAPSKGKTYHFQLSIDEIRVNCSLTGDYARLSRLLLKNALVVTWPNSRPLGRVQKPVGELLLWCRSNCQDPADMKLSRTLGPVSPQVGLIDQLFSSGNMLIRNCVAPNGTRVIRSTSALACSLLVSGR